MNGILLVDDDDDRRVALAGLLRKFDYSVRSARNGRDALLSVCTAAPAVIALVATEPESSGLEFLQVIRSYLRWRTIPIILLTALEDGEHIARARDFGIRCVFRKGSYELTDLYDCIQMCLIDPNAKCGDPAA
jgi:CheY-like chemotaxis protein